MSALLPVQTCPVKHCGKVHPAERVDDYGCPSCSIGAQQVLAYAEHRRRILAEPLYAEAAARFEHAYYHPVDPRETSPC